MKLLSSIGGSVARGTHSDLGANPLPVIDARADAEIAGTTGDGPALPHSDPSV